MTTDIKLPALKPLKMVVVEWSDILDDGPDWTDHKETHVKPVRVRTVGFLFHETKKHIVIVRDYYDHEGKRTYGGRLAIPVGCIEKMTQLSASTVKR